LRLISPPIFNKFNLQLKLFKTQCRFFRDQVFKNFGIPTSNQNKEIIYQNIFHLFCEKNEINPIFYPLGNAANYSLLYLISRIIDNTEITNVIELGVGQTTILLNELCPPKNINLKSFENDSYWAHDIQRKVHHKIYSQNLISFVWNDIKTLGYDFSVLGEEEKFDFIIVDGPEGAANYSRLGVIKLINSNLAEEFVLLFDDAERKGERQTIELCKHQLKDNCIKFFESWVVGLKSQCVLATPKYKEVEFY